MKHLLLIIISFFTIILTAYAESIPYEDLVGVWTLSQGGPNHNLTKAQVSELCGTVLSIIHPNRNMDNHIRFTQDGKLMMSMDVLSKNPCTYTDNQLSCEMEFTAFGKSHGIQPGRSPSIRCKSVRQTTQNFTRIKISDSFGS